MKQIFSIFGILLALFAIAQNKIEFVSEDITFEIRDDTFFVNGTYYFKNIADSCTKTTISYPFPQDKYLEYAEKFELYTDTNTTKYSIIDISKERIVFVSEHCNYNLFFFNIKYRQKLLKDSAKYILTTTRNWKKALQIAEYKLIIPNDMEITFFSYPPDSELLYKDKKIYIWQKPNFYPDNDFLIKYKQTKL